MNIRPNRWRAVACSLIASISLALPASAIAEDWEWLVAPYAWVPSVKFDQSGDGGGNISGSDLIDKTDAAGMIRIEAKRDRFGILVDYIFLGLSDDAFIDTVPAFPQGINVRADLDLNVLELAGTYRLGANESGADLIFGLRRISSDKTLLATPVGLVTQRLDLDNEYNDVMLGGRYLHRFNERWDFTLRGDVSFGDSEGTLNLQTSIGFHVVGPFSVQLGYRHAELEYEEEVDGGVDTTKIDLSGAYLGAVFRF